jgi:hypothetical protein
VALLVAPAAMAPRRPLNRPEGLDVEMPHPAAGPPTGNAETPPSVGPLMPGPAL